MKMIKKAVLSLGMVSAIAAPIAAVVSCASIGKQKDTGPINVNGVFNGVTLRVGMRMDEMGFIKPALTEFSNVTGARIKYEAATPGTYSTMAAMSSGIADVTLVEGEDTNVQSQRGAWFEPFVLRGEKNHKKIGLLDNPTYNNIQYGHGYELDTHLDLTDDETTDTATMRSAKWKMGAFAGSNKMNYLPAVFGPRLIYGWRHDANGKDMFDGSKNLEWWVPKAINNTQGGNEGLEKVDFSHTAVADNPLLKPDGSHYKNTYEDVKEFLLNSAKESQRTYNQVDYNYDSLVDANPRKRLIATGQEGYKQRLYSVTKTLKENGFNVGEAGILEYSSIDIAMMANGKSSILRTADSNKVAYNGDMVDDTKWAQWRGSTVTPNTGNLWNLETAATATNNSNTPDAYIKLWLGQFGYLNGRTAALKQLINATAEASAFAAHKTAFFNGQKWVQPSLLSKSRLTVADIPNKFVSFPEPFSDPGVDGYAVKMGLTGLKKDAAFALLRFMMQEKVQAEMAGTKTLPIIKKGRIRKLNDPKSTMFDKTAAASGFGAIDANDRLKFAHDIISRSSTDAVLNEMSILAEKNTWEAATFPRIAWPLFTQRMESIRHAWHTQRNINGGGH